MTDGRAESDGQSPESGWRPKRRIRLRTPTTLQMEAVECGAAALAMILAYHGRFVSLEHLRGECGVSRDGSKASNLVKVGRQYNLISKGFTTDLADLEEVPLPCILFWNFNHFVVLEGYDRKHAYLNDPAAGPRTITLDELEASFTGVVLSFEKNPEFKKGGTRKSFTGSLLTRVKGSGSALTFAFLSSLALVIPGLIEPSFIRVFLDKIIGENFHRWILWLLGSMGAVLLVQCWLTFLQQLFLARLETRMAITQSATYLWHLLHLPVDFFTQRSAGDLSNRVRLNDNVAAAFSGQLATAALHLVVVFFYAALMFYYDRGLTAVMIGLAALNFLALRLVSSSLGETNMQLSKEKGLLMGTTMNGLTMMETLKATGREADFFVRWSGSQARLTDLEQRQDVAGLTLTAVPALMSTIGNVVVLTLGGLHVIEGLMTIGMLTAFQGLCASFDEPVNDMVSYGSQLQQVKADIFRLDDILAYPAEVRSVEESTLDGPRAVRPVGNLERLKGFVELRDVEFGYCRLNAPLISGFHLKVLPGQRVALVGATGSGKSTVARLVSGLYEPWSGQVLLDGQPRHQIDGTVLAASLALVDQDICMFGGSVRDNLTLWDRTLDDEVILCALRDAGMYDCILARPGGLDGKVEERGGNFSGGERQRLEIARALVTEPSILVMDEATSALDPLVEKLIDERLRSRGCTCIIVAHRLSTIRDCDEIIVMEGGQVVQRGTHDSMARVNGPYRRLIAAELAHETEAV